MSHVDAFFLQCHLHLGGQSEQTQMVGNSSTALAYTFRDFILCHAFCVEQVLVCQRYLDGVQVFTLYVLNQCQLHHCLVRDSANVCGDSLHTDEL